MALPMLVSVMDRTREIGVRKAVGATRREILWQFLVESGMLTPYGAGVGMMIWVGSAFAVAPSTPMPAAVPSGGWSGGRSLGNGDGNRYGFRTSSSVPYQSIGARGGAPL